MKSHQIHIFISHAWAHSNHYNTLSNWIFNENWKVGETPIKFLDFSVPKSNPIHNANNDKQLREALYNQISRSHVIVIPTGMYASHSKWIQKEIEGAKLYNKPILAVNPMGQQRKSGVVTDNSHISVGWNKKPVIDQIWKLYNS